MKRAALMGALVILGVATPVTSTVATEMPLGCVKAAINRQFTAVGYKYAQDVIAGTEGQIVALPTTAGAYTVRWARTYDYYTGALTRKANLNVVQPGALGTQLEIVDCY